MMTTWSPDTCKCQITYDKAPEAGPGFVNPRDPAVTSPDPIASHFGPPMRVCSDHQGFPCADSRESLLAMLLNENQMKNHAYGVAMEMGINWNDLDYEYVGQRNLAGDRTGIRLIIKNLPLAEAARINTALQRRLPGKAISDGVRTIIVEDDLPPPRPLGP